jgi:light-regulated signal transduction histidine kinase (bacteriophytochrome)
MASRVREAHGAPGAARPRPAGPVTTRPPAQVDADSVRAEAARLFAEAVPDLGALGERVARLVAHTVGDACTVRLLSEDGTRLALLAAHAADPVFSVADDGPGIPLGEQERIFERFQRADTEATRATTGSGLGLPIARALAELHGGRIWVESTPGHGATFRVAVPLDAAAREDGQA